MHEIHQFNSSRIYLSIYKCWFSSVAELNRLLLPSFCCLGRMTENSEVATGKGIRIPQYGKFLLGESRILGKFCCLIRNPGMWIPEYSSRYPQSHYWLESRKTHWQRLESSTWNPRNQRRVIYNRRLSAIQSRAPNVNFRKISVRKTIWDLEFS